MTLNDPKLVATLASLHDAYESALAANDVAALDAFFWESPQVVRYGVAEQLYGADALAAYRRGHVPPYSARRLVRREIALFGPTCGTVMAEIELTIGGRLRPTRQSQTWVKLPDLGWRIVAAHVSAPLSGASASFTEDHGAWGDYAERVARALGLPIDPAHRDGVAANLARTAGIVSPLLAFDLPDDVEPAPVFSA